MMGFNIIGRGASSVARAETAPPQHTHAPSCRHWAASLSVTCAVPRAQPRCARTRRQVRKAIHVPTHRFVALKVISIFDKASALRLSPPQCACARSGVAGLSRSRRSWAVGGREDRARQHYASRPRLSSRTSGNSC